ncbi:unnamed protein product, partial [Iphiclides podalirius]
MPSPLELKVQVGLSGIDLPLTTDDGDVTPTPSPSPGHPSKDVWTLSDVQLIMGMPSGIYLDALNRRHNETSTVHELVAHSCRLEPSPLPLHAGDHASYEFGKIRKIIILMAEDHPVENYNMSQNKFSTSAVMGISVYRPYLPLISRGPPNARSLGAKRSR